MYKILICDDERDIRNALRIYLTGEGYAVCEADSGLAALELMQHEEVQLVLMDVMMPGMDGMTATAKLREQSNVPVILITAKSEDNDKILGLTVGADDYITKPFNPLEVLARVKAQLRRYAQLGGMPEKSTALTLGGIAPARCFRAPISTGASGRTNRFPRRERCRCISAICAKSWRSTLPTRAI